MTEYTVALNLRIEGRAIAVDLSDAVPRLPVGEGIVRPHMTVLWRPEGYTQADMDIVNKEMAGWAAYRGMSVFKFTLEPWGPRSKLVKGPLEWFGQHIRDMFPHMSTSTIALPPRPLHVELKQR